MPIFRKSRSPTMRYLKLLTIFFAANILASANIAAEEAKGFTIYPHFGQTIFGDELDDDMLLGIGVGYRFDSPWAIELTYQQTDADFESPLAGDTEIDLWHLGALYHLKRNDNLQPFLSFGIGKADYNNAPGKDEDNSQVNAGVGVKWSFNEKAAIRGDFKIFTGASDDQVEAAVSLGLHYAFGATPAPTASNDGDSDNDGVPDSADHCLGTSTGIKTDRHGCPEDDDGDGVYNNMDACPNTTDRRARIDEKGCYVRLESKVNITLNVEFDFDSSEPRDEHIGEVQKVADFMVQHPHSSVVMEGHTDSVGTEKYNQNLSEQRASTIADMLIKKFNISQDRISFVGYGESQPVKNNNTAEGRQHNRRVVAVVEGNKEAVEMK